VSEHRFRFRRGELELELAGDRDFIEAQVARWLPQLMREAPAAPSVQVDVSPAAPESSEDQYHRVPADFTPKVSITLADLVRLKEATSPMDLVTVAGYYLEKYRRLERYTPDELARELAELAAWDCHTLDEPFELAVASGFFEQLRDGSYTLTYKGQTYVQNGLAG
jgi:hypothetical protein